MVAAAAFALEVSVGFGNDTPLRFVFEILNNAMISSYDWTSRRDEINWRKAVLDYINMIDEQRRKQDAAEKHELAMAAIAAGETAATTTMEVI